MEKKTLKPKKTAIVEKPLKAEAKKPAQIKQKNNKQEQVIKVHEIDATNEVLGRLATKIATILRGKDKPTFYPYLLMGDKVVVTNAGKMMITGNKLEDKKYYHHTGYLGNLKERSLKDLMKTNPAEVLERAVYGMLPANKLRASWMKNLTILNGEKENNG